MDFSKSKHFIKWLNRFKKDLKNTLSVADGTFDIEKFINEYEMPTEIKKKPRNKNIIPNDERCCALVSNNNRCSRRVKSGGQFCGTHEKGTPNGVISDRELDESPENTSKRVEIIRENINGIVYNIDMDGNVYDSMDLIKKNNNPKIIGKYRREDGKLTIE